jgi:CTP synthase
VKKIEAIKDQVKISIIGKYIDLPDAYLSVIEALKISGYQNGVNVLID